MYSIKFGLSLFKQSIGFHVLMVVILAVLITASILLQSMSDQLKTNKEITKRRDSAFVYLASQVSASNITSIQNNIAQIDPGIGEIKYVAKQEVLETLRKSSPEMASEFSALGEAALEMIPHALVVSGKMDESIKQKIGAIEGVQVVEMQGATVNPIIQALHVGQLLLGSVGMSVGAVAIIVLFLIGRILSKEHYNHMQLIKQIGGNPRDQILPFFFSQMTFVILSSICVAAIGFSLRNELSYLFSYLIPQAWSVSAETSLRTLLIGVGVWIVMGSMGSFAQARALRRRA